MRILHVLGYAGLIASVTATRTSRNSSSLPVSQIWLI